MRSEVAFPKAQARRELLKRIGVCINAPIPPEHRTNRAPPAKVEHGPPVSPSGRCQRCDDIHKVSR